MKYTQKQLKEILSVHKKWLNGKVVTGADFGGKDLMGADLTNTDLRMIDFRGADLRDADLRGANIDFSCLPLWCGSLNFLSDEKQTIQIMFHLLSLLKYRYEKIGISEEELKIYNSCLKYANKFHREEVKRLEKIKREVTK